MDDRISEGLDILQQTLADLVTKILNWLPAFLGGILVLVLGFFVAKFGSVIIVKLLKWIKFEKLVDKTPFKKIARNIGYKRDIPNLLGKLFYWAILLLFLSVSLRMIGLPDVSDVINSILGYIPNIAAALIILLLGTYIAKILRDAIEALFEGTGMPYPKYAGTVAQVVIYVMATIIALDQLRFDTQLITSNLNIIIGGLALAFGLSAGLAGRTTLKNMIAMRTLRSLIRRNYTIEVKGVSGRIVDLTKTGAVILDSEGHRHFIAGIDLQAGFTHIVEHEIK